MPESLAETSEPPVVVLHGTLGSPGNFQRTAQLLAAQGRRVVGFEYGERGTGDIDASTAEVNEFLSTFDQVDVVAHSQGALLALRAAHGDCAQKIRALVGVGPAWRGVPSRWWKPLAQWIGGPAFGQLMHCFPAELPPHASVVSIVSDADSVVPRWSSELGQLVELTGVHHARLPEQALAISSALDLALAGRP